MVQSIHDAKSKDASNAPWQKATPWRATVEIIALGPSCVNGKAFRIILSYHLKASFKQLDSASTLQFAETP